MKVWDINDGKCDEAQYEYGMPDIAPCIRWSPDGKMLACGHKNKHMTVVDVRSPDEAIYAQTLDSSRVQRLEWIDDSTVLINGFQKQSRMWGVWDIRNTEQPLATGPLPDGSGIPYFSYDREL